MARKKNCRVCQNDFGDESLIQLSGMPGAVQNLPTAKERAIASGVTLDVRQCSFCGLVQLTNDPVPYYKDVIRAGGFSPSMRARQKEEFKLFIERFSLKGKNILEIGSGRGEYLSILNELSVNACGMEHNPEFNQIANENGLKTYQSYPIDIKAPLDGILFDAFVSINFLEHSPYPGEFLRASANLLSEDGVGMIAVPDIEFELRDNFVFSFMSDHLSYFSAETLENTLRVNGFDVIDIYRNETLHVVTAYFRRRKKVDLASPNEKFNCLNNEINEYLTSIKRAGGRVAVWGASHLAFSIISASKTEKQFSYIVDSALFKQGRYSPASGLQIFPPQHLTEDPVDSVVIMCPEYSDEIIADIKDNFSQVVQNISTFVDGKLVLVK